MFGVQLDGPGEHRARPVRLAAFLVIQSARVREDGADRDIHLGYDAAFGELQAGCELIGQLLDQGEELRGV